MTQLKKFLKKNQKKKKKKELTKKKIDHSNDITFENEVKVKQTKETKSSLTFGE